MSDPPQPDEDQGRPTTPEERSHVRRSDKPASKMAMLKRDDTAWLKAGKGVIDVTISERVNKGGKYYYRVKDKSGKLWKDGNLVPQSDLTPNC